MTMTDLRLRLLPADAAPHLAAVARFNRTGVAALSDALRALVVRVAALDACPADTVTLRVEGGMLTAPHAPDEQANLRRITDLPERGRRLLPDMETLRTPPPGHVADIDGDGFALMGRVGGHAIATGLVTRHGFVLSPMRCFAIGCTWLRIAPGPESAHARLAAETELRRLILAWLPWLAAHRDATLWPDRPLYGAAQETAERALPPHPSRIPATA